MVENPHTWKRAQVDIDTVIGTDRLPEFDDRASLPYVEAIIRETMRWRPVTPIRACYDASFFLSYYECTTVAPHAVTCSDIYDGYYIPKGMS